MGNRVNLVEFAQPRWWTGSERHDLVVHELAIDADGVMRPAQDLGSGEWQWGLEWREPRDVRQVVVRVLGKVPSDLCVQYWQHTWPSPAPERLTGARRGWIGRDDPWHGRWITVRAECAIAGDRCTFTFDPVDLPELRGLRTRQQLEDAEHYLARFRRTLKLRLVSRGERQPQFCELGVFSSSTWREGSIDVHFGEGDQSAADWSGKAEVSNGHLLSVEPLCFEADDAIDADGGWRCRLTGKPKGIRLGVRYADCAPDSGDRTAIAVHTRAESFSFLVADLNRGAIQILDYGVTVTWQDGPQDAAQVRAAGMSRPIYDRVAEEPEHSLCRAMAEIPPLDVAKQNAYTGLGRYLPLGVEAGRQEFALRHNGELFVDKDHLKLSGRDAARLLWPGHQLRFRFGTGDPPDFRETGDRTRQSLLEGWLPVVVSRWLDREIAVKETAFVALLDGDMAGPECRRGDEDVVAMLRFVIRNTTHGRKRAHFWLYVSPQEELALRDGLVVARGRVVPAEPVARAWRVDGYETPCLRAVLNVQGRGTLAAVPCAVEEGLSYAIPTAVVYSVDLTGGEACTLTMAVPFVSLCSEAEWRQAASLDFEIKLAEVVAYWRRMVEAGGQMDVPDVVLADFHKAVRTHVAISADKDPVSGLIVVPAATWSYGACGNEACWQVTMLDQAGHHDRAASYLDAFLQTQGLAMPDGLFSLADGAFLAMDFDGGVPRASSFGYNLDHGYIMECLANHYRYSGDRAWLARVTPQLIAACDFVIRERAEPEGFGDDGQMGVAKGLLPAGHLEDNPEWRHWFAVNAHAYAGMRAIADVLREAGHPEAERLDREAKAYRADIRRAARRAMIESPVVQLLDDTYIPHLPTRAGIRGREWGWFREAAYGALHLLEGGVFEPHEKEMTWVLKDLEDNLFVSRNWGRPVDVDKDWFSHGGVTIQPSLMDLGIDYLRRGQIKHALRALFNNFGASLYADVRTFTEHPVVELGHGVGPFYKSSDESKALVWLRHFLLHEEGEALHLAMGAPRAWFAPGQAFGVRNMATLNGAVSYRIASEMGQSTVEIAFPGSRRPQELIVHLRRAAGQRIQAVTVNGMAHHDFDPAAEIVRVTKVEDKWLIVVDYVASVF